MTDTQWPRYQVFLQEREDTPFQDVGSVHAPDAELALLNARDVFVRRPECNRLWVVPAGAIYFRTLEELQGETPRESGGKDEVESFAITCKLKPAGTHLLQGQITATTPAQALQRARGQFDGLSNASSWMVFPTRMIVASDPSEIASLFRPALNKPFRMSTDFQTVTAMRVIKLAEIQADQSAEGEVSDGS
jgi:ring-1,2-phenylacetyl-CoA epoxidase subunit PaaB